MKYLILPVFASLIALSPASAQFKGGSNDGIAFSAVLAQNALPNIFRGGNNDGHASITVSNQNAIPGIYLGGNNDGVALANVSNQNAIPGIYLGGINDGVSLFNAVGLNASPGIYAGGFNDGHAIALAASQNALPGIYLGGLADGVAIAGASNANALPGIYFGGAADGYAITVSLNQNPSGQIVPLPLELLKFSGSWFNDDAVLAWETGEEGALDHFELERSDDAGRHFDFVSSIALNAQSGEHDYRYTDVKAYYLPADFLLYRLKCVGRNGGVKYSATVRLNKDKSLPVFVAYPNPTAGRFTLAIMNVKDIIGYDYVLSTMEGKILKREKVREANTSIDLSGFAASTYHLSLFKDGKLAQHFTISLIQ